MDRRPINLTVDQLRAMVPDQGEGQTLPRAKRAKRQSGTGFNGDKRRDLAVMTLRNLEGYSKQQVRSVLESALAMLDC